MSKKYVILWFLMIILNSSYGNEIKSQDAPWYIDAINANSCSDITTGKDSMVMLIDPFDSPYAIPEDLEPLKGKIYYLNAEFAKPTYAFVNTAPIHESQHVSEHATAVAGLIANYQTNLKRVNWLPSCQYFNNILVAGVAPDSKIVFVGTKLKLITGWPLFLNAYEARFNLKGITLPDKNGIQKYVFNDKQNTCIINFSAGDLKKDLKSEKIDEELDKVLEYLKDQNVLIVTAAGNEGVNFDNKDSKHLFYYRPQEAKERTNLIVVGATKYKNNTLSEFSNRSNKTVDIAAPGEDISVLDTDNTGSYGSGTSFSAPLVSGTLALAIECNPLIEANELKEKLFKHAITYDCLKEDIKDGKFLDTKSFIEAICLSDDGFSKGEKEIPKKDSKKNSKDDHDEKTQTTIEEKDEL